MNECQFCNKIYNTQKLKETYWAERDVVNCITHNEDDNTYNIWHGCEDDYYSDEIFKMKFWFPSKPSLRAFRSNFQ